MVETLPEIKPSYLDYNVGPSSLPRPNDVATFSILSLVEAARPSLRDAREVHRITGTKVLPLIGV